MVGKNLDSSSLKEESYGENVNIDHNASSSQWMSAKKLLKRKN